MRIWRIVLVLAGLAVAVLGAGIMLDTVSWKKLLGLAIWLAAAIVIHDGIIAPGVFAVDFAMRKAVGRRVPTGVIAILQSGIVVGSVITLIVIPEILAQRFARIIPTLLDPDYGMRLGAMWAVIAVVTAGAIALYLAIRRRQNVRPLADQA
jgi:hypothetical protein